MKIGYARVSTVDQNLDRQMLALKEAGCEKIYKEKLSGMKLDRKELQRMLSELQTGDTIIVKELTRVSRSTVDLLQLVKQITDKGCFIKSLSESWLDTTSASGKLMLTMMAGIAEFERSLMLQRCNEGRIMAVSKGVKMGRPKILDENMNYAIGLYMSKAMSIRKICASTGVSKTTLCRRIKELELPVAL